MADPEHLRHVLRHRNIFKPDSGESSRKGGDDSSSDDRESGSNREVISSAGKPCIIGPCRCICEHKHNIYNLHDDDDGFSFDINTEVTASHDHCPVKGHGLHDYD